MLTLLGGNPVSAGQYQFTVTASANFSTTPGIGQMFAVCGSAGANGPNRGGNGTTACRRVGQARGKSSLRVARILATTEDQRRYTFQAKASTTIKYSLRYKYGQLESRHSTSSSHSWSNYKLASNMPLQSFLDYVIAQVRGANLADVNPKRAGLSTYFQAP